GDREAQPGPAVGPDQVDIGQRLDVATAELLAILAGRGRRRFDGLGLAEFEDLSADSKTLSLGQFDRLADSQVDSVERAEILDDQTLRAVVAELHVPHGHAVQPGELGAALGAANVEPVGVDRPPVAPAATVVEDLERVAQLRDAELIDVDAAEEASLTVIVA